MLSSSTFARKKFTVCQELRESIIYPSPDNAINIIGKKIALKGALHVVKEGTKIVLSAGLGLSGLPISVGASLFFKALDLAGLEIGENRRQMIAVLTTSEALINNSINLNEGFGKDDLAIFENFLNAKKELIRLVKRKLKRERIEHEFKPFSNIEFAKLIASVEESEGSGFYCKGKPGERVRFKGFGRKVKMII
jgi:hypothetical protein